jgi:hypothetical protein
MIGGCGEEDCVAEIFKLDYVTQDSVAAEYKMDTGLLTPQGNSNNYWTQSSTSQAWLYNFPVTKYKPLSAVSSYGI